MSKRGNIEFLNDIHEATQRIEFYIQNIDYDTFLEDTKTQDAVVRNLEIIGEAIKNLSEDFKGKYLHIPWKDLAGVRDKLIHHYFGVNLEIVWTIIKDDLPPLKDEIRCILDQEKRLY
jgi:uncharacterized protein with HEPN domain